MSVAETVPSAGPTSDGRRADGSDADAARREARARAKAARQASRARWLRAGRALVRWMPLPVASALGQGFGGLVWWAVPWLRRQTLRNVELAYGDTLSARERRRIARRSFALLGRGLFAWLVLHRMGADRALARLEADASPEVADLLRSDTGLVLISPHMGLFDLSGVWLARNARFVAVGRDAAGDAGTSLLIEMRRDMGLHTIEQGGAREVVRTLRGGGRVGLLADQDIRKVNGAFVPFFGRPTHAPIGPAAMAVRFKVPVVCVVPGWRSFTRHTLRLHDVLRPREDLPHDEAVLELTARCTATIERAIRRCPEEWLWMHDRWRTSPADRPEAPVWTGAAGAAGGPAT